MLCFKAQAQGGIGIFTDANASCDRRLRGDSPQIQEVNRLIRLVAHRKVPILITGETGTGKEIVASTIAALSNKVPFVAVNLAEITESIAESLLFGHTKGSFTGASSTETGLIAAADGGTLFLDEIGKASLAVQAKLLRVLESGEYRQVGSNKTMTSTFRLITATSTDLEEAVKRDLFLKDLYYRIKGFPIRMPPLRELREDLLKIAYYLLQRIGESPDEQSKKFSEAGAALLLEYDWPGNVRELKSAIEYGVIMSETRPLITDLDLQGYFNRPIRPITPAVVVNPIDSLNLERALLDTEINLLRTALQRGNFQIGAACLLLEININTLRYRLQQIGMDRRGNLIRDPYNRTPADIGHRLTKIPESVKSDLNYHVAMNQTRREAIIKALNYTNGNFHNAALHLGVHHDGLRKTMRLLNISFEEKGPTHANQP